MAWLPAAAALLYIILSPFIYVISWGFDLLHLLITPFVKLGLVIFHTTLFPFKILAKFEALFIFLAVALLIGATLGLVLYVICTSLVDFLLYSLGFSSGPHQIDHQPRAKGQLHYSAKELKKEPSLGDDNSFNDYFEGWNGGKEMKPLRDGEPLFSSTILEEDEYSQSQESGA
ncbi:hypothetical protein ASPWEDRAFT_24393 [Aspergillus wentii DTO 134E9]|uniref:Uncharacterized protein n=1 Tax=Aspergillus wentii DTO 134E9 TaxID=1073089 RepID=A0A1L9RU88_ASPWE|nr:uncharacterized protein ASPWEDRAFT_24393 [Aspergillus wentii DTO 134E9]OJJ38464.1 hypothetical protein ASPWEDRAFT_24393 [Aspergillus wentii DTO 134E9]